MLDLFTGKLEAARCPPHLRIQLHDVGHLVPAKAHKARVIAWTVTRHHHIGLIVSCPLHPVWCLSLPPAGIVRGRVPLGPLVVPVQQDQAGARLKLGACWCRVGTAGQSSLSYLKV